MFSKISFPANPNFSINSVRSYMAFAMLLWYDQDVRTAQDRLWQELQSSWKALFHSDLNAAALETWLNDDSHAFTESQWLWLTDTLRMLKCSRTVTAGRPSLRPRDPSSVSLRKIPPQMHHGVRFCSNKGLEGGEASKKLRSCPAQTEVITNVNQLTLLLLLVVVFVIFFYYSLFRIIILTIGQ
jgi:hypothetical protein